jgi:hypothetical protein
VELTAVIGDECSGWASGEGVEEHAEGEREQSLGDAMDEPGGCSGEVVFEPHLAFEVRDRRFDHQSDAGEAVFAVGVAARERVRGMLPPQLGQTPGHRRRADSDTPGRRTSFVKYEVPLRRAVDLVG